MTGEPRASSRTSSGARLAATLCVVLGLGLGLPARALAGPVESLREGLFGSRPRDGQDFPAPPVARYVSEDGDIFTLDRTQPKPVLKFDNSGEMWTLQPQPAPRGDTIYRNELGEPVLRSTRMGGMTLFTDQRPGGSAAALAGAGNPLRLLPLGPQALAERLLQASARASRAARRLIPFEAEANPGSAALIGDAATVTSEAVVRMSRRSDARRLLDKILKVRLIEGRKSSAQLADGVLQVMVAPPQGLAGRPSSDRIVQVAEAFH
jgi:hypothetical protein